MSYLCKATLLALMIVSSPTQAVEYKQVQPNQSTLTFAYKQMGVPLEGKFNKFAAQVSFDPAKLAQARARIDVTLASIDTGSSDADEAVAGKLWFNTQTYPLASFVSNGVRQLAGNGYQATGKLSIKGRTLDVTAPVTYSASGNKAIFDGSFNIRRTDFAIGEGEWRDLGTVADDIQIKFHLTVFATPVKK